MEELIKLRTETYYACLQTFDADSIQLFSMLSEDELGTTYEKTAGHQNFDNGLMTFLKKLMQTGKLCIFVEKYCHKYRALDYVQQLNATYIGACQGAETTSETPEDNKFFDSLDDYLAKGQTDAAIDQMISYLKSNNDLSDEYNNVIGISGRFRNFENDRTKSLISYDQAKVERAQINESIQLQIKQLKKKSPGMKKPLMGREVEMIEEMPSEFMFEKIIGGTSNLKKIAWLEKAIKASDSICRISTPVGAGTGFLVHNSLIITNNHVISAQDKLPEIKAQFNFQENLNGDILPSSSYAFDPDFFFTDKDLDITVVRVVQGDQEMPLTRWGALQLLGTIPNPGEHVSIIQHPSGGPKQVAINENKVTNIFKQYIQYTTDTLPGSSGSPIFNDNWKVVGLHHAGGTLKVNDAGDRRFINQGILMKNILEKFEVLAT